MNTREKWWTSGQWSGDTQQWERDRSTAAQSRVVLSILWKAWEGEMSSATCLTVPVSTDTPQEARIQDELPHRH